MRYGSRVCRAIQGKEWHPSTHLGVVATKTGAFESLLMTVGQFTTFLYVDK